MRQTKTFRSLLLAGAAGLTFAPTVARAQDTSSVEVSAFATIASNPFVLPEGGSSSEAVGAEISPSFQWRDEVSQVRLRGTVRYEEWLDRYDSQVSGSASVGANRKLDETTSAFASAGFRSSRRSVQDFLLGDTLPIEEDPIPEPDLIVDPSLAGEIRRSTSASATFGLQKQLSPTSALSGQVGSRYDWQEGNVPDYRTTDVALGYSQQVGVRTSMNINLGVGAADYVGQEIGDGIFGNATVGLDFQLSETGSLSVSGGASFADLETGALESNDEVFLIASVDICERVLNGRMCTYAQRSRQPTSLGSVSTLTSAGFGWSTAFRQRERLALNISYSQADLSDDLDTISQPRGSKFLGARAIYSLPLTDRLSLSVAPSYSKLLDNPSNPKANYQARIRIGYRFGG